MKIASLTILILLSIASSCYAQPEISFDKPDYNFSVIGQGDHVEHMFEFINVGYQELIIERLHAS